jgi:uncharacterized protein with PIN domain
MFNPVCVECKVQMRCKKNGVNVSGTAIPHYQSSGDMYRCPNCEREIVIGFGSHFDSNTPADLVIED